MAPLKSDYEAEPHHNQYEAICEAIHMTRDLVKKLKAKMAKLAADQQKRMAENQAKQPKILKQWRACRKRDEIRIAEIEMEAAPRDKLRLAQLKEEEKKKKAERRERKRKARKAKKEEAEEERLFRKDLRERNQVHDTPLRRSTRARVEKAKRVSPGRKRELEEIARKALAHED